jgi:hypothetical protein
MRDEWQTSVNRIHQLIAKRDNHRKNETLDQKMLTRLWDEIKQVQEVQERFLDDEVSSTRHATPVGTPMGSYRGDRSVTE